MTTEQIIAMLVAERDKLTRAIEALGTPLKRRGRPPGKKSVVAAAAIETAEAAPKKRKMSAAGRKRIAAAQKKRWAELKKAQA